ncbi:hypothetical protein [Veronia pacifica]|uniref:Uncharacterized protein n=1 Tax=Veronia pacifica TaxID=1080227 RepID=A0A1C3EPV7_9GAMM|nr:hypothetical protein [Veronia pacifica]ODA35222.1 hypothetical protein A8L45_04730 [Veronia pacifica]
MKRLVSLLLFISFPSLSYEIASADSQQKTSDEFASKEGAPAIYFTKAIANCESNCRNVLIIGNTKYTYSPDSSVVVQSRYRNQSWAIVREAYQSGDDFNVNFWLVNSQEQTRWSSLGACLHAPAKALDPTGRLVCIADNQLNIINGDKQRTMEIPVVPIIASINNNLNGDLAIALVDIDTMALKVTSLNGLVEKGQEAWQSVQTELHLKSDFEDTLIVFPKDEDTIAVASYEYVNVFNKGLATYLFSAGQEPTRRVVANSFKRNYGTNPDLYLDDNSLMVSAFDSTQGARYGYQVTVDQLYEPEKFQSIFTSPTRIDVMAGYGLMNTSWYVDQETGVGEGNRGSSNYKVDSSLLQSTYFQGRIDSTQLTFNYLTSAGTETSTRDTDKMTEYLSGAIDFESIFDGPDALRLRFERFQTYGIASHTTMLGQSVETDFEARFSSTDLLVLSEQGYYFGLGYRNYRIPGVVGFTSAEAGKSGWTFDNDFEIDSIRILAGKDEFSFGSRYEASYSRFYIAPQVGVGINKMSTSNNALLRSVGSSQGGLSGEYAIALSGQLDLGYAYQRRSVAAYGLGYALQVGYRARADYSIQDWYPESDSGRWQLNYSRADIWHGPYIQFNVMF